MRKKVAQFKEPDENEMIFCSRGRTIWRRTKNEIDAEYTLIATANDIRIVVNTEGFVKDVIYETTKSWELFSFGDTW